MDNQVQKKDSQEKALIKNLAVAIISDNVIDVAKIDKVGVNIELKKYKTETGTVNFPAVFKIPVVERIPAMAAKDLEGTIKLITVALTMALEALNLKRPMTNSQVLDLAEVIVDTAAEGDNLAMEDLMLFLQKLTRGEYPELYESMDQVKFMSRLDKYRDERWEAGKKMYDEKHLEYKNLGDKSRVRESENPLDIHLSQMSTKIQTLKDELKEQKDINKRMRDDF